MRYRTDRRVHSGLSASPPAPFPIIARLQSCHSSPAAHRLDLAPAPHPPSPKTTNRTSAGSLQRD
eukprot:scaffold8600_cov48-Phaeocystis_antarctica.AAC.2